MLHPAQISSSDVEKTRQQTALGLVLLVIIGISTTACSSSIDAPVQGSVADGGKLYADYCALCHGDAGQGYAADSANALNNQNFLKTATDDFIRHAIERGRPGTVMSAWGVERGGPVDEQGIEDLLALLRSWQTEDSLPLDSDMVSGSINLGATNYNLRCLDCHGEDGAGGLFMSLNNPEFLATASDAFIRHAISQGRPGTSMPGFEGQVTEQTIDDLVALIRSWQTPIDESELLLPDDSWDDPTLNPNGSSPEFEVNDGFVSVDGVKEALDANAKMVLIDARPPSDYVTAHIAGAVSVPFYDVASYIDRLPKDTWLIAYCACPHAEAGEAAAALKAQGFSLVAVVDEGFYTWQERGYPTETGSEAGSYFQSE
jgi:cytochrome c oxidase cbb3-type subunit 3